MNILRRISLTRLLIGCASALALGVSLTALALALGTGPTPPAKPLAQAVHDALAGGDSHPLQGFSATVQLADHLLEGANLATGGQGGGLTSSPLVGGGSGRLWVSADGRLRMELQAEQGDTEILYDGTTVQVYDAAANTLYRYTPKGAHGADEGSPHPPHAHEPPTMTAIEEAIAHLGTHAIVSGATPTDVGGQPAYTVRLSPREGGSLLGGVELSFDANRGVPLRAAVYATGSSSPVIELTTDNVSYEPVESSVFAFSPPSDAKVQEVQPPSEARGGEEPGAGGGAGKLTVHGHGPGAIAVLEDTTAARHAGAPVEGLPQAKIGGASASELRTALGTVLSFERGGVGYLVLGSVTPEALEAFARGL